MPTSGPTHTILEIYCIPPRSLTQSTASIHSHPTFFLPVSIVIVIVAVITNDPRFLGNTVLYFLLAQPISTSILCILWNAMQRHIVIVINSNISSDKMMMMIVSGMNFIHNIYIHNGLFQKQQPSADLEHHVILFCCNLLLTVRDL